MRILIISDVSSRMRGGVPAETLSLVRGLTQRGHSVALATDQPLAGAEQAQHFPITIPVNSSLAREIEHAIERFKPDFVHVICMSSMGVKRLAPLLRSRSWALTVHSVPPYERKLGLWHECEHLHYRARALRFFINGLAWRWIFRSQIVPMIIVHSKFVENIVVSYGASTDRVRVIPLAFDAGMTPRMVEQPVPHRESPLLVTVGGFAHTKGQHDVVKALPVLLSKFPGLRYQIIGEIRDHSYVAYLRRLAQDLKVTDHLHITPDLDRHDKETVLRQAHIYIQPSHEEGFCIAYAEAAATVPRLVGTDAGAIAAMSCDDAGARVIRAQSPPEIALAVSELLQTSLSPGHMTDRVLRLKERFSSSGYLQAHEELYGLDPCLS